MYINHKKSYFGDFMVQKNKYVRAEGYMEKHIYGTFS